MPYGSKPLDLDYDRNKTYAFQSNSFCADEFRFSSLASESIDRPSRCCFLHRRNCRLAAQFASGRNPIVQTIFFFLLWMILRVPIVRKNHGQSLGRWALDMKIIDVRLERIPGVQKLCKREGLLGICAALAFAGVGGLLPTPPSCC